MQLFVARQPILDRAQKVYGYELLFRSGIQQSLLVPTGEERSAHVISNSFFDFGLETMTDSKRAFINFTSELLLDQIPSLFSREILVVELLENVPPTLTVRDACARLRDAGYMIALDDFTPASPWMNFLELADVVKVDFKKTTPDERALLCMQLRAHKVMSLAEKVETPAEYEGAREAGFDLFQGYFFRHPQVVSGTGVPMLKLNHLRLMKEAQRVEFDLTKLEELIRHDVSLTLRLLKFMNSAAFGMRKKVESIKHALVLLGPREVRRWVTIVALAGMLNDRCEEILVSSIIRARFCELLAPLAGFKGQELEVYFLGMFSTIDVVLERRLEDVVDELPVTAPIRAALLGDPGPLRSLLDLVSAYERGAWEDVAQAAARLKIPDGELPPIYQQAISWTSSVFIE